MIHDKQTLSRVKAYNDAGDLLFSLPFRADNSETAIVEMEKAIQYGIRELKDNS